MRKVFFRASYFFLILSFLSGFLFFLFFKGYRFDFERLLIKISAYNALFYLILSFGVTPFRKLVFKIKKEKSFFLNHFYLSDFYYWRKKLGILGAYFAFLHVFFVFLGPLSSASYWVIFRHPFLRNGFCCFLILFILWASSFSRVLKQLRLKYFFKLHGLFYLFWPLLFFHIVFMPQSSLFFYFCYFFVIFVFYVIRLMIKG